jgi:hypothetical protein
MLHDVDWMNKINAINSRVYFHILKIFNSTVNEKWHA